MPQVKTPHEFLVRWDDAGNLKGAHIAYREAFTDDAGVEQFSKFADPRPVALTDATLLAAISSDINAAAIADGETKAAQIATLTADLQSTQEGKAAAESARDAALAQVAGLQAQLAALQPVINGVPQFIKKWQLWAGLRMDDPSLATYNAVKAYTESFTGMKRDLWLDSTGIERSAPALDGFKAGFHKTDADLDDMFTRYAAITLAQASTLG